MMSNETDYRLGLCQLADRLGITDDMAGEEYWQEHLAIPQIEEKTLELFCDCVDAECSIVVGNGDDRKRGTLEAFRDGMAVVRWGDGVVATCPIGDIESPE